MRRGRSKKIRFIQKMPSIIQFSPRGKAGRPDEVELRIDHFEAIKLADFQDYSQFEGAKAMGVSRPTFGRILREARAIVAGALIQGKIIRIRTGSVQVGVRNVELPPKPKLLEGGLRERVFRKRILKYPSRVTKRERSEFLRSIGGFQA